MMEETKELIFEELSVSDKVTEAIDCIEPLLLREIEVTESSSHQLSHFEYCRKKEGFLWFDDPIFGIVNDISFAIYLFDSKEQFYDNIYKFDFGGETNMQEGIISLVLFGIGDSVEEKYLREFLVHELHHVFQMSLIKNAEGSISNLYKSALNVFSDKYAQKNVREVAEMIYFLDKKEIDANMQSIHQDLSNDGAKSHVLEDYEKIVSILENYSYYVGDDKFNKLIGNAFGLSFRKIHSYLEKQRCYFERKKRKVFQKLKNEKERRERIKEEFIRFIEK